MIPRMLAMDKFLVSLDWCLFFFVTVNVAVIFFDSLHVGGRFTGIMSSPAIVSSIAMYALVLYGCKFIHKPTLISGAVIPLSLILLVASGSRTSLGQSVIGILYFLFVQLY